MKTTPALLVLEDGSVFEGRSFGACGTAFGEAVFNTGMCGYQEVLTDPSYRRQVVAMTAPHIGNYGVNAEDVESTGVQVAAFVVREAVSRPSNWRSSGSLVDYLAEAGVPGIEGVDTRRLTRRLRMEGAMRAVVSSEDLSPASLLARVRLSPEMVGADLASEVTCSRPYGVSAEGKARFKVAAYDFGIKTNITRLLAVAGCDTSVYPAATPAEEILATSPDGMFLSNGPGDPAAVTYAIEAVGKLLGRVPIFGICLGHQLLGLALGAKTYKLKFGHRGVNQPVKDLAADRVEVTSHNHGFAVEAASLGAEVEPGVFKTRFGRVVVSHVNLNDDTVEGLRCLDIPAFSVQYHPEAAPGPHDAGHLFEEFSALMTAGKTSVSTGA
ncbi:MAG: glutamine-hydrolyzing carbamoyl-phosphate synthase small subunit [Actinomycetota bacterium]